MTRIIRRDAICTLAGAAATLLWGPQTGHAALPSYSPGSGPSQQAAAQQQAAMVTGTLTAEHREGRRLSGFLETGVYGGQALCSLVQQDEQNPMIMSVFAAPSTLDHKAGVQVTICFFSEPVGDVQFSLLHIGGGQSTQTASKLA